MLSHLVAFVISGIVQVLTAVWGGIVSVKSLPESESKLKHYWIFVFLGFSGSLLTIWLGLQTYQGDRETIGQQTTMQHFQQHVEQWQKDTGDKLDALSKVAPPSQQQVISKLQRDVMSPKLTLEAGPSTDARYAFETRFILTNRGPLQLTDATYACELQGIDASSFIKLNQPVTLKPVTFGPIGTLAPDKQHSIYCDFTGAGLLVDQLDSPLVQLRISYKYGSKKGGQGFQFLAIRKPEDKTFVWLPRGEAQEVKP